MRFSRNPRPEGPRQRLRMGNLRSRLINEATGVFESTFVAGGIQSTGLFVVIDSYRQRVYQYSLIARSSEYEDIDFCTSRILPNSTVNFLPFSSASMDPSIEVNCRRGGISFFFFTARSVL